MRQGLNVSETSLPKKRPNRGLEVLDNKKDKYIYKRTVTKTEQNLIQNYFEYLGKKKVHYQKLEKSSEAVVWQTRSQPHFKEFIKLINETFDMNKDYDTKELDRQKMKVDKVIEELEKWILEPQDVRLVAQPVKLKSWDESFKQLMSSLNATDRKKRQELVLKIRSLSATPNKKI